MAAFVVFDSSGTILGSYTTSNGNAVHVAAITEANTPAGATALAVDVGHPALVSPGYKVVNGALQAIVPTDAELLAAAQVAQNAQITAASTAAQTSGFTSSALGSPYTYPSTPPDQANLTACVTASIVAPAGTEFLFWCTAAGTSAFVPHTSAQIQAAGLDAMKAIMTAKQKQAALSAAIQAATTVSAVQAVVWS